MQKMDCKIQPFRYKDGKNPACLVGEISHSHVDCLIKKHVIRIRHTEADFMLRFLGITLRVLRHQVSVYNVYVTNQFQTNSAQEGGGGVVKNVSRGDCE
jgi:hypothetical protein